LSVERNFTLENLPRGPGVGREPDKVGRGDLVLLFHGPVLVFYPHSKQLIGGIINFDVLR
jgi:hypothetical protein